jgi:hypothetical protein
MRTRCRCAGGFEQARLTVVIWPFYLCMFHSLTPLFKGLSLKSPHWYCASNQCSWLTCVETLLIAYRGGQQRTKRAKLAIRLLHYGDKNLYGVKLGGHDVHERVGDAADMSFSFEWTALQRDGGTRFLNIGDSKRERLEIA